MQSSHAVHAGDLILTSVSKAEMTHALLVTANAALFPHG